MTTKTGRLSRTATLDEYYEWLCEVANVDQPDKTYWLLIKMLYNIPFKWSVPNDDNRGFEGKNLRERFCDEYHIYYEYEYFNETASVLEVFIALADRCKSIMMDQNIGVDSWFWKLLSNVELDKFTDDTFKDSNVTYVIEEKVAKIIERRYEKSGKGGLFPLKYTKKDQRKVELWYQMNEYLIENYYMDGGKV